MEPPARPLAKRRPATMQQNDTSDLHADASPSPGPSKPKSMRDSTESHHPASRSQLISVDWQEDEDAMSRHTSRLQIEMAECVETKTVTTTTTTKRSYPPLLIPQQALANLDLKEYPLALKDTPADLAKFSYELDRQVLNYPQSRVQRREGSSLRSFSLNDSNTIIHNVVRTRRSLPKSELPRPDQVAAIDQRRPEEEHSYSPTSPRLAHRVSRKPTRKLGKSLSRGLGMHLADHTPFPATPDPSEVEASTSNRIRSNTSFFDYTYTPQSGRSQESFDDVPSPVEALDQDGFANAVATPPIAESDLEPVDESSMPIPTGHLPQLDTLAAQNASLPSPGLSPASHSSELDDEEFPDMDHDGKEGSPETQSGDSQEIIDDHDLLQIPKTRTISTPRRRIQSSSAFAQLQTPSVMDVTTMLSTFEGMPSDMQSFMMYQLLRRCSRKTLHVVANAVNPALKCDFLDQLPLELGLHILSFLDFKDLCRAAQVSRQWRVIVDSNETGWKELFDRDGFVLPAGELERAIHQGWGWQDPYGVDGYEQDMSVRPISSNGTSKGTSPAKKAENDLPRRLRASTKRKRGTVAVGGDRAKRVAVEHEFTDKAKKLVTTYEDSAKFHKSEGPLTSASLAVSAVPDPQLGVASLRTHALHLFKSLYRRHHLLQESWMSGKVEPHHFAFPAHPNHVITCLQFDDDKIITGSDDTLIHVYDTKTGQLRKKLEGHDGGVWALQYEGNVHVSGSTDRSVRVWDIEKGLCTQVFHGHTSTVRCLQILMPELIGYNENVPIMLPEKPLIITGSRDSQLRVWRLPEQGSKRFIQTGPPANDADCPYFVRVLSGHSHSVRAIAAHRDTLVSGSYDTTVRVWKISTGETLHRLHGHAMKVYSVVLDHKRNRCISGSMDNFVKIWSLDTGACLFTLDGHSSLVGLLDLRDERLVSAAADSTLRIWDPENGQCKSTLTAHTGAITCFQHDGRKVVSGSDKTLKMWDIKTGECTKDLLTDLTGVWQVKFDERRCVAAVQRDNLTFVEVLDFGASRDGIPASMRGSRRLIQSNELSRAVVTTVSDDEELL